MSFWLFSRMERPRGSVVAALLTVVTLIIAAGPAQGEGLLFRPTVGRTYTYELSAKKEAEMAAFEQKSPAPIEEWKTLKVTVMAFRSGVYVLDILDGKTRFRRYVRPTGEAFLAPSERMAEIPVFLTLPPQGLEPGKTHTTTAQIPIGTKSYAATWKVAAHPGATDQTSLLKFTGELNLPSDRVVARKLAVQGELVVDAVSGIPVSGEWKLKYALDIANKEIAVIRPLWKYRETRHFTLKQKGG